MSNTRPRRDFDKEAATWDDNPAAVNRAAAIADAILSRVTLTPDMDVMDFGAGTGLVTLALQPHVRSITAADTSTGMLAVLKQKADAAGFENVRTLLWDFENDAPPDACFHVIVSSMTLHHVPETARLIGILRGLLHPGGVIAIADLDAEDGSFHPDKTGVEHFGFDRGALKRMFENAGLRDVRESTAFTFSKVVSSGETREFSVFLISGTKLA
jgi:ubiquinone/menaquinone biosynthesis C-methylase UbiE